MKELDKPCIPAQRDVLVAVTKYVSVATAEGKQVHLLLFGCHWNRLLDKLCKELRDTLSPERLRSVHACFSVGQFDSGAVPILVGSYSVLLGQGQGLDGLTEHENLARKMLQCWDDRYEYQRAAQRALGTGVDVKLAALNDKVAWRSPLVEGFELSDASAHALRLASN